jgi:hypothetical protein
LKYLPKLLVTVVFIVLASLATDWTEQQTYGYSRWPLWGDKGGYFIYLPFAFEYGFDGKKVPVNLEEEVGKGFTVVDGTMVTKYPIGVAYMELPFYAIALTSNKINQFQDNPYQGEYARIMVLAPALYVSIGLYLLFLSLRLLDIRPGLAFLVAAFAIAGTSLFYYTVMEGLMSHSFSFALFATLTYLLLRLASGQFSNRLYFWLALVASLIVLVRPFNILLMLVYGLVLLQIKQKSFVFGISILRRLLPWLLPIFAMLLIPQLLYYKYAYGSFFTDSYTNETFDFFHPQFISMLFSANAGLFVYSPAFLLFFGSVAYMSINAPKRFALLSLLTLFFIYLLSSWHSWSFGCGFGIRPFVEWIPLLLIPTASLLNAKPKLIPLFLILAGFIVYYNYEMTYKWTGCWFGNEESFKEYFRLFWS